MIAPTSFGLPAFLRIFIPGVVFVLLFLPLIPGSIELGISTEGIARFVGLSAMAGTLLFLLDTRILRLFEGRLLMPIRLRIFLTKRATRKLENLVEKRIRPLHEEKQNLEKRSQGGDAEARRRLVDVERELGLLYDRMLDFPVGSDGRPFVVWPTRFGNILAAYEYYPEARYGMDSSFYWYRIWAVVDDNTRKEMDSYWALTQAWMYISVVSLFALVVYLVSALHLWTLPTLSIASTSDRIHQLFQSVLAFMADLRLVGRVAFGRAERVVLVSLVQYAVISGLVLWFAYSATLEQLRVSGEFSKAMFDLFRGEIVTRIQEEDEKAGWNGAMLSARYAAGNTVLDRRATNPSGKDRPAAASKAAPFE